MSDNWIIIRERVVTDGDDDDWVATEDGGNNEQLPGGVAGGMFVNISSYKGMRLRPDGSVLVTYYWLRTDGTFYPGAGTVTLTPLRFTTIGPERSDDPATVPPTLALHGEKRVSAGEARPDCVASELYTFDAGPGPWTLRITDMAPPHADATRLIILGEPMV